MMDYDAIRAACVAAIWRRARQTGARLNVTYTTPEDLAADAWLLLQERPGWSIARAADEATRRALRAQARHTACSLDKITHIPAASPPEQIDLPPILRRIADGWTLAEIAAQENKTVSAIYRAKVKEINSLCVRQL